MEYRSEIDGLRAFSLLAIILFHSGLGYLPSGFLAVDVFFVISGYLISAMISSDIVAGRFSFRKFYLRRARRLLPSLFFVVAICLVMGWLWLMPEEYLSLGRSVIAAAMFMANFFFWRSTNYFDRTADEKPLIHLWTLSTEEQFYILFPVFATLLLPFGAKWLRLLAAVIILGGFAFAVVMTDRHASASFYLLPTRLWEFGLGAALAHWKPRSATWSATSEAVSALGFFLICMSFLAFDGGTFHPGPVTLIPTIGTCMVIGWAGTATAVGRLLTVRLLVFVGVLSYGAYLWHQPVFAFSRALQISPLGGIQVIFLSAITMSLALITWFLVEQPFRGRSNWVHISDRVFMKATAIIGVATIIFAAAVVYNDGMPMRLSQETRDILFDPLNKRPPEPCHHTLSTPEAPAFDPQCARSGTDGTTPVILIGDSHASVIGKALDDTLAAKGIGLVRWTFSSCPSLSGFNLRSKLLNANCQTAAQEALNLARAKGAKVIVVAGRWPLYLSGAVFDNQVGGREEASSFDIHYSGDASSEAIKFGLETELTALAKEFDVIFVQPIPEAGWDVPKAAALLARNGPIRHDGLTTSYQVYLKRVAETMQIADRLEDQGVVTVARIADEFCSVDTGRCANLDGNDPLYFDDDHLNSRGSARVASVIAPLIESRLKTVLSRTHP